MSEPDIGKIYEDGFHDGAVEILQDLIESGDPYNPTKLLERIDYWSVKLKLIEPEWGSHLRQELGE